MPDAAPPARIAWQTATITAIEARTPTLRSFFFRLPRPFRFHAGQHVDVRLTAPDGYQAQRSYSIASAPDAGDDIELAIERLDDGEVSPFFHDVAAVGDGIELRGPIGGHFVWRADVDGPALLVGGGSGVVPLVSMVRHRVLSGSRVPLALVYSARTAADLIFGGELQAAAGNGLSYLPTLTREVEAIPGARRGRIDAALLREALGALGVTPATVFVCGTNAFVGHVTVVLAQLAIPAAHVRTERYGG